jgi:hypothetical protein
MPARPRRSELGDVFAGILSLHAVEQDELAKRCVSEPAVERFVVALLAEAESAGMLAAKKRVLKRSKARTPDPHFHGNYRYFKMTKKSDREVAVQMGLSYEALRQRKSRAKKANLL